jgi:hypothetical protein
MDGRMVQYSPLFEQIKALCFEFEDITNVIKKAAVGLYTHSQSALSKQETKYFHEIAMYFDGNCRRNKKIINIYAIIKNLLGDRIIGWYQSKPVTIYILKLLIKFVLLFEQWPYRMCFIFQLMEDYKESLTIMKDDDFNTLLTDENKGEGGAEGIVITMSLPEEPLTTKLWLQIHARTTLSTVFKHCPEKIFSHKELHYLARMDHSSFLFDKFLHVQEPIITVEYFYLCLPYIFNINYCIKNKIAEISDYERVWNT